MEHGHVGIDCQIAKVANPTKRKYQPSSSAGAGRAECAGDGTGGIDEDT
jgi:hypothetical protein